MADIITDAVIPDTGVAYPYRVLKAVINATWNNAIEKQATFDSKVANILNTGAGFLADGQKPTVTAATATEVTVTEPAVFLPTSIDTDAIIGQFDSKYLEVVTVLSDHYAAFITNHFPNDSALFSDAVTWLSDAINNPEQAIPQAIRAQMIEDERARITAEATRASAQVLDDFAARGFPIPTGAAVAAAVDIQTKAMEEVSKVARAVVVKNFEMSYEKIKFAVGIAIEARKEALAAAVQYIGALATAPDTASKALNIGYDAQSKLISAVSQFYGARTQATELALRSKQFNATQTQNASVKNADTSVLFTTERVKALTTEAQALSQMTTSLFNNLNVSANTGASDTSSTSVAL